MGSLNALRKEYKLGLKEITLSPDEDPAEALMRYNAASIREALERASQEPLEITGDQLAGGSEVQEQEQHEQEPQLEQAGEQQQQQLEYGMQANGTTQAAPAEQFLQPEYVQPATVAAAVAPANDTIVRELAAARVEFKQLYSLIQSLKNQLTRAEQSLTDCQFDATSSTTASTSSSTSTTTPTPPPTPTPTPMPTGSTPAPTAAPAASPPVRSNAIQEEKSWESLLASKGYDTKYLTKSNVAQQLDTARPESMVTGGDYSYQELQPYDPDNKAKRASGNGTSTTTERSNVVVAVAKLLNSLAAEESAAAESASSGDDAARADNRISDAASTPTPYALRGKFVRRGVRTTRQAIGSGSSVVEPWNRSWSQEQVLLTKLDRLIGVLNDLLRLQLQRERSTSSSSSGSNSIASGSGSGSGRTSSGTSRMPSKVIRRLRRRKLRRSSTTQAPQNRIHY